MQLEISQQERDDIAYALQMRIAVVETGDPALRANDAIQMGKPQLVRAMSTSQRELISRHEAMVKKLLSVR
jgi:hypothetical protein